jgi:hypothetical protein
VIGLRTDRPDFINAHPFAYLPPPYCVFSHFLDENCKDTYGLPLPSHQKSLLALYDEALRENMGLKEQIENLKGKQTSSTVSGKKTGRIPNTATNSKNNSKEDILNIHKSISSAQDLPVIIQSTPETDELHKTLQKSAKDKYDEQMGKTPSVTCSVEQLKDQKFVQGQEIELTGQSTAIRVRLYKVTDNTSKMSDEIYVRIPVSSRAHRCPVFSLGPHIELTGEAIKSAYTKLKNGDTMPDVDNDPDFWRALAGARKATIRIYQISDTAENNGTDVFFQKEYKNSDSTIISIVGRPGHFNALVPVTNTDAIAQIINEQQKEIQTGWYPYF